MSKIRLLAVFLTIGILLSAIYILQTQKPSEEPEQFPEEVEKLQFAITERKFLLGVTANPAVRQDTDNSFEQASQVGEMVNYAGGWVGEGGHYLSEQLETVFPSIEKYGLNLTVEMNFWKLPQSGNPVQDGLQLILPEDLSAENLSNTEFRYRYRSEAVKIAEDFSPAYFALGIEVNIYYMFERQDFDNFILLYNETYDAVKSVSPNTKVFVSFRLELMKLGFPGYEEKPHWELIERFGDKLDFVAFTTYPHQDYADPQEIPENYYAQIANHTQKRICFTEIGWPHKPESSEQEQINFIARFVELTAPLDIEFVQWIMLHDTLPETAEGPATSFLGLRTQSDREKLAWYAWKKLAEIPFVEKP